MSGLQVVRRARPADAAALAEIYNPYVLHSTASFEEAEVTAADMEARLAKVTAAGLPWLVVEDGELTDPVQGYAYVAPFSERPAYRHALEVTVYLREGVVGRGLGTRLYEALVDEVTRLDEASPHAPVHRLYARIALPRPESVALHERFGFVRVGLLSEAGFKQGTRIDVGYWELALD